MQANYVISSPLQEIGQAFLETKYGRIFYLCCGFHGDPLILIIHGSGPANSSKEYEFFLFEYIAKVCFMRRFFIVAIDCPGYGNSTGSKQTVRSYPLELIEEIYRVLNYQKAFALFGHSQGGASIFNAVFQKQAITDILIMDRPVCGDIKRFINFPMPCLLIYDIEDDGHPIAQGKLLNKYLKFSQLLTFRTSREQYWIADNLWDSVLEFIRKIDEGIGKRSSSLNEGRKGKGGVIPSEVYEDTEYNYNCHVRNHHSEEKRTIVEEKNEVKQKKFGKKKKIIKEEEEKKSNVLLEKKLDKPKIKIQQDLIKPMKDPMKKVKSSEKVYENVTKPALTEVKQPEKFLEKEEEKKSEKIENPSENNYLCPLCLDILYKPIQLTCGHNFCLICLNDLAFYETRCPLCRKEFPENYDKTEKNMNQKLMIEMKANLPEKRLVDREQKAFQDQQKSLNKKTLFMGYGYEFKEIQIKPRVGNVQTARKYEWKVFVKQLNYAKQNMIKFVEFDINVGIIGSKPIKVEKPPFVLEGKGGFMFTALIKVTWDSKLRIGNYETFQRLDFSEGNRMKKFMIKLNS